MQENKHGSVNIPLNTRDFQLLTSPMAWTIPLPTPAPDENNKYEHVKICKPKMTKNGGVETQGAQRSSLT